MSFDIEVESCLCIYQHGFDIEYDINCGWSGGAMVLGKLPVPGRPTIWMTVGQGPIVLAVGAGGGCFDIFTLIYPVSPLSPSLWETARYRLKYCCKGPLNPKTNNQPIDINYRVKSSLIRHIRGKLSLT